MSELPTGEVRPDKSMYGVLKPDNDKFSDDSVMPEVTSGMHLNLSDALLSSVGTPGESSYFFFKVSKFNSKYYYSYR